MSRSLDKTVNVSGLVFNAAACTPAIHFALVSKRKAVRPLWTHDPRVFCITLFKSRNGAVTLNVLITMVINV